MIPPYYPGPAPDPIRGFGPALTGDLLLLITWIILEIRRLGAWKEKPGDGYHIRNEETDMSVVMAIPGAVLVSLVLWDAFETIVFPRRVTRRVRLATLFYRSTWKPWKTIVRLAPASHRGNLLSVYGPISLILLLGFWASMLVFGFGLMHMGLASLSEGQGSLATSLYFSGTTFFTLGLGDVRPLSAATRLLTVIEAGIGLGFLAIVIGYLPALNQSFSRREVNISLLDSRAGSPPTASEMLLQAQR